MPRHYPGGTANARTGTGADHSTRLLLLDEPSLGLAPLVTARLMTLLLEQTGARDMAVVVVEQNARSALSIARPSRRAEPGRSGGQ